MAGAFRFRPSGAWRAEPTESQQSEVLLFYVG
jgi:hypothetical protein